MIEVSLLFFPVCGNAGSVLRYAVRNRRLFRCEPEATWMVKIFLILAAAGVPLAAQIFPAEAKLEKLYEGGHLTEGAAVASDGTVYFSDITFTTETRMQAGHILRY